MTSFEKIRESIDEVVAQVMLRHAEQLRNEVGERVRVHVEEDAKHLGSIEQQLRERSDQAQALEQQLSQTRNEIADKQKHIESMEQQLRDEKQASSTALGRIGELENNLKSESERLNKHAQELEQLLEMSQEEVKQLQKKEEEQRNRHQELERQVAELGKSKTEAIEAKERDHAARVQELQQKIEATQKESAEKLEGKERELLEQVHLLEELLVQGQQAREQQLEAKDREVQITIEKQKSEHEARVSELTKQLADRDKMVQEKGGELQERIVKLEKELSESQSVFEKTQQQLDEANAKAGSREQELRKQLDTHQAQSQQREQELAARVAEFEKKIVEFTAAEQDWKKREQELLGHRDKVLNSSAEASEAGQKALKTALEDQSRLQAQCDGLLEELARVREELATVRSQAGAQHVATVSNVADPGAIEAAIEEIKAHRSQSEILKALLEGAAQFAGRTGILVVNGRTAQGWATQGLGANADFRRWSVDCAKGLAAKVVQNRTHLSGRPADFDHSFVDKFGAPHDNEAHLFPLVVLDRVAAFFYADGGTDRSMAVSTHAIDTVVQATSAWLNEQAQGKGVAEKPVHVAMAAAAMAPQPEPAAIARAMAAAGGSSVPLEAPVHVPENGADASRQKARRFAKLLVDEIKLYNKDAVEQGRQNRDLYDRLRESIDKSRASYDKRWGKTITDADYFREELVRNLAENNPAALGGNFR